MKATVEKTVISGNSKGKYISKGERPNVNPYICKLMRRERSVLDRTMAKLAAWQKGYTPKGMEANQSLAEGHVSAHWSRSKWPNHDRNTKDAKMPSDIVAKEGE